jgi:hypothetical protein
MTESSTRPRGRSTIVRVAVAFLLLAATLAPSAVVAGDGSEELDIQLREQFDEIVGRWAEKIWDERNDAGDRYKRASFSQNYRKVDDSTYKVAYSLDTIVEEGQLRTELCDATLSKASGKWELTDHTVSRSIEKLMVRDKLRDHTAHRFDTFELEREGLAVRASNGTMILDYLDGEL